MSRTLDRVQRRQLYSPQFSSFEEYAEQEWQIRAPLAREYLRLHRTYSRDDARDAGVVPVVTLRGLAQQMLPAEAQKPFLDVVKVAEIGTVVAAQAEQARREARAA